jgi:hypothetical protein
MAGCIVVPPLVSLAGLLRCLSLPESIHCGDGERQELLMKAAQSRIESLVRPIWTPAAQGLFDELPLSAAILYQGVDLD